MYRNQSRLLVLDNPFAVVAWTIFAVAVWDPTGQAIIAEIAPFLRRSGWLNF